MASCSVLCRLSRLKLVTFDVTGTLISLRNSPGFIYERVAREEFGYKDLKVSALDDCFWKSFRSLNQAFPNYGREQNVHWKDWWTLLVQRTFKDGANVDPEKILSDRLISLFETDECWMPAKGALELVKDMQTKGIITGIITNSDPRTVNILRNLKFGEFQFVHSAYETGLVKPDPVVFDNALKYSSESNIKPNEAMHVGNDPVKDFEAANNCNWTGVLIDKDLSVDAPEELKFKSLCSFREHLRRNEHL